MAETAAHLVDQVFPHVPARQWVLSVPKRLRPFLHHRPRTAGAVLHILLRALKATLREACPTAPVSASFGAVSFLHRFGSSLNPHYHFHVVVVDGLFERAEGNAALDPAARLRFHEATALTPQLLERLQHTMRERVLRQFIELSFASFDGLAESTWERFAPLPERPLGSAVTPSWSPTRPQTCSPGITAADSAWTPASASGPPTAPDCND